MCICINTYVHVYMYMYCKYLFTCSHIQCTVHPIHVLMYMYHKYVHMYMYSTSNICTYIYHVYNTYILELDCSWQIYIISNQILHIFQLLRNRTQYWTTELLMPAYVREGYVSERGICVCEWGGKERDMCVREGYVSERRGKSVWKTQDSSIMEKEYHSSV